tara:strand:- start:331 stop:810 length:480 start_codon:yes stop_codon:yes gene_type:complete
MRKKRNRGILERILKFLLGSPETKKKLMMIDPERLHQKNVDNAYSKIYSKIKKTYDYGASDAKGLWKAQEILENKGKKVKCWRLVKSAWDYSMDEYIPIFYKKKKIRKKPKSIRYRGTRLVRYGKGYIDPEDHSGPNWNPGKIYYPKRKHKYRKRKKII